MGFAAVIAMKPALRDDEAICEITRNQLNNIWRNTND